MNLHNGQDGRRSALFEFTGEPFEPGWRLLAGLDHPEHAGQPTELGPLLALIRQTLAAAHASALDAQVRLQDTLIAGVLR